VSVIGGTFGIRLLNYVSRNGTVGFPDVAPAYIGKSKLETLFGRRFWDQIRGKVVLDFGCGPGAEAVEMAERGAARVIGVDLRDLWLEKAQGLAIEHGVSDRCVFGRDWHEPVDVILSLDSFEHFSDPASVLEIMHGLLKPSGRVLVCFGPTWYHPLGGHIYSVFPYSHLLFSEPALVGWRSLHKTDGARTIEESGLNRMTVRRFERLVAASPFRFGEFEAVPIRKLRWLASRPTREFTTAVVRCTLLPR
jgi:SAM-dependent methyltransferase